MTFNPEKLKQAKKFLKTMGYKKIKKLILAKRAAGGEFHYDHYTYYFEHAKGTAVIQFTMHNGYADVYTRRSMTMNVREYYDWLASDNHSNYSWIKYCKF